VLSNLYHSASLPSGMVGGPKFVRIAVGTHLARPFLAILVICSLGIMTGSAAGAGIKLLSSGDEKPAPAVAAQAEAKPKVEVQAPVLTVADPQVVAASAPVLVVAPPKPAPAPAPKPKPVVKTPVAAPAPAVAPVSQVVQPAARCAANQVMDDGKINWLLDQSAKTLAENPSQAAGAAHVNADLRSALGKNMCAAEAQALIANTCTDPAAVKFLNTMVSRLPFFIKPMVGNPCTADLVAVLNKMGKFIT
jgi:hypothetical protein